MHVLRSRPAIFTSGFGRSGTTALRMAIAAHPTVASSRTENNLAGDLLEVAHRNATLPSRVFAMQVDERAHDDIFADAILRLTLPEPNAGGTDLRPAFATHLTPDKAERALRLFPGSRFVCIVRDGVSCIESRLSHASFGRQPFIEQCRGWAGWGAMYDWIEAHPCALLIRYEQLRGAPGATLAAVLEHCDLPPCSDAAETLAGTTYHPTPADARPTWQSWPETDRELFVRICGPLMHKLGYAFPWRDAGRRSA